MKKKLKKIDFYWERNTEFIYFQDHRDNNIYFIDLAFGSIIKSSAFKTLRELTSDTETEYIGSL